MLEKPAVREASDWVIIGRFGRPHGVKGEITVQSYTDPRDNIIEYKGWCVLTQHQWKPIPIVRIEPRHQSIVVLIDGYNDRDQVAQLTNREIAVKLDQLPALDEGEYYWHDLVGMSVINTAGVLLGVVSEIMATGSNEVLVVIGTQRHLIPFRVGAVVTVVDGKQRQITVDWDGEFL